MLTISTKLNEIPIIPRSNAITLTPSPAESRILLVCPPAPNVMSTIVWFESNGWRCSRTSLAITGTCGGFRLIWGWEIAAMLWDRHELWIAANWLRIFTFSSRRRCTLRTRTIELANIAPWWVLSMSIWEVEDMRENARCWRYFQVILAVDQSANRWQLHSRCLEIAWLDCEDNVRDPWKLISWIPFFLL